MMSVTGLIPLRAASDCTPDGAPRFMLDGVPLWDLTLRHATEADCLSKIVIAHDDPMFEHLLDSWRDRVIFWRRPPELSGEGVTTVDVLTAFARHEANAGNGPDAYLLMEITHPLRPKSLIADMVAILKNHPAEAILTVRSVHYPIWRPTSAGLQRLQPLDSSERFCEEIVGLGSLFSPQALLSGNPFDQNVDVVPIERFWAALDVRNEEIRQVAEQYIRMLKQPRDV